MSFEPAKTKDFIKVFEESMHHIRNFEGCSYLELFNDVHSPNVYFTYSFWESEHHLENYRNSELFKRTWAQTKVLFNDNPQAWTVRSAYSLK